VKTSVILPSFKRAKLLNLGLWSLAHCSVTDLEVVVLNDGIDTDDTAEVCASYSDKLDIKYIFTGQRNKNDLKWRVPGYAINIGVKNCSGEIIILSNPEIFHTNPNNIKLTIETLKNQPTKSFVSPSYIYFDDKAYVLHYLINEGYTLDVPKEVKVSSGMSEGKNRTAIRMPFFTTMYKESFMAVGGYDEDFKGYAGDDNDFMDRIMRNGVKWVRQPLLNIVHLYHGNSNDGSNHPENPAWLYNYNLWQKNNKEGIIVANEGRGWGIL
jgi:glycosyltransferase involved in cell wall biosynthesis